MALAICPSCQRSIQVPNVATSADSACPYCRDAIWLYKCFSCMKVTAFDAGSKPAKCPRCFTMVRSDAPLGPLPPLPAVIVPQQVVAVAPAVGQPKMIATGIAVDNLSRSIVDLTWFAGFVEEACEPLNRVPIGREFLREFDPEAAGVRGGGRYPKATVVIKPPTAEKIRKMESIAETNKLTFFKPCDMAVFAGFLGQVKPAFLTAGYLLQKQDKAIRPSDLERFQSQLAKYAGKGGIEDPNDVCLAIPAFTDAASPSELLSNSGGEVRASQTGSVLPTGGARAAFVNILQCFEDKSGIARADDLKNGTKYPAQITVFFPGSTWAQGKVENNGDFSYYGQTQNLRDVVFHELIHCYHLVIGSNELSPDSEDEKRAVGLYEFKNYKYSENVFRAHLKRRLRLDYPRLGVKADPELEGDKPKYDFLDSRRIVVDPKTV